MRRSVSLVLVTIVCLLMPGLLTAHAGGVARDAELRAVWIVAGGAAAQARYRVVCQPDDRPVILSPAINQGRRDYIASGSVVDAPCTGAPVSVTVSLRAPTDTDPVPVRQGEATAWRNLWNCLEGRDPCFELVDEEPVSLEHRRFRTPFDEDLQAELTLVRSRLTREGDVRVAYDLMCTGSQVSTVPLGTVVTQVSPRGRLVWGSAVTPSDGSEVACGPDVRRFRLTVSPTHGVRFREGRAFVDSSFGSRLEWGVQATDSGVIRLERPAR